MTRIRTFAAVCALALPIPAVIAGCGGDDSSSEDPQTVLDETFNNDTQVTSGDLSLTASVSADGDQGGSFEASLNGPFQGIQTTRTPFLSSIGRPRCRARAPARASTSTAA